MKVLNFNIFYKVLLTSIVTLIATAVIGGLTARLIYDTQFHSRTDSFAQYIGERIGKHGLNSKRAGKIIDDIDRLFSLKLGIFDEKGNLVNGDRSFFPKKMDKKPPHSERVQLIFGKTHGFLREFKLKDRSYFLLMSGKDKQKLLKSVVVLAVVLLIIVLVAYIFARTIITPLSKIASAVNGFGKGDFSARTNLCRNDEIGDLAKSFNNMADKINHLMTSEKELLANVSHEIRTPLSRIRIALEISEEVQTIDQIRKYLSGIDMDLVELEQLIDDVLTSTKLDFALNHKTGTNMILREEPSDLMEIINSSIERFEDHNEGRTLTKELGGDSFRVSIDKKLIKRVVDNLLDNAVKYSSDDIKIKVSSDETYVYTEVIDMGFGLSKEDMKSIFNPFFRAEKSRVKSKGGIGLGLTLCQRILKAHGEEITVASEVDSGSTFKFRLKLI